MISDNVEFLPPINGRQLENFMSLSLSIQKLSTLMYEISSFPQDSIVTPTPFEPLKIWLYHKSENFRINQKHISIIPPSFMKFCPVVPEIWRGQVHVPKKERRSKRRIIINNKSPKRCLRDLINWIFIELAHRNNSLHVVMSPNSDTLSVFQHNQSLLFLFNASNNNFIIFGLN